MGDKILKGMGTLEAILGEVVHQSGLSCGADSTSDWRGWWATPRL